MPEASHHSLRRRRLRTLGVAGLLAGLAAVADAALPTRFHQDVPPPLTGLVGTSMTDVVWSGRYLWVATERGLARWDPAVGDGLQSEDWRTFTEAHGLGRGSVSALAATGDTVWAATLFDTIPPGLDRSFQVGSGLAWSTDGGVSWRHRPNEALFDTSRAGFEDGPTTPILNPCFGLSVQGDTVWAAFLAGSSIRSTDFGQTWDRVLPGGAERIIYQPADNQSEVELLRFEADSLEAAGADGAAVAAVRAAADSLASFYLLHRTFSVTAYGDTVWIGTSSGLASSFDFGRTWTNHKARFDEFGDLKPGNPGADWTVTVEREITETGQSILWTGTRVTDPVGQRSTMNYSADDADTWVPTGPISAWDFAFAGGDTVWAGTDLGLVVQLERDGEWFGVEVADPRSGEQLEPAFVGVERFALPDGRMALWAGADNGLGRSLDGGATWTILSFPLMTPSLDTGAFLGGGDFRDDSGARAYAAPSPFAPSDGRCRVVYSLAAGARVDIEIFDFASRRVRDLPPVTHAAPGNYSQFWDGRDDDGARVGNGTYFIRVHTEAGDEAFTNVVVLD